MVEEVLVAAHLWYGANDLHGHFFPCPEVYRFHDLAEGALTEQVHQRVLFAQPAIFLYDVVPVFVINFVRGFRSLQDEDC